MGPDMWSAKAYPSLKPLAAWVVDLLARVEFIQTWIEEGMPATFWISGFYFPQAFLTGTLQNFARKHVVSIDTLSFDFQVLKRTHDDIKARPEDGCYIYGLFLEGARYDPEQAALPESRPKELYTSMPPLWLRPVSDRPVPQDGVYVCPCYKRCSERVLCRQRGIARISCYLSRCLPSYLKLTGSNAPLHSFVPGLLDACS